VAFLPDGGQDGRMTGEKDEQTSAPESHTGIQGEGGAGGS